MFGSLSRKTILVSGLLFFSFLSNAQDEEKIVADTTAIMAQPDEETEVGVSSSEKNPFSNRWDTLSVKQRSLPGDAVKKMKEDEDFWYANANIKKKKSKEQIAYEKEQGRKGQKGKNEQAVNERDNSYVPLGQRSWFQTLLWIVILAVFATGLAIYLGGSNVGLFRKKNVKAANAGEEEITGDIFAINYQKEIDKAAAQGNYRLAIRLMFLRLLKNMSEKNIIRYKQDKTNLDYLMELHPTNYYNSFFRVTRNYEYSWYGQFNVSEDAFKLIRSDFDQFDKELR
ncbi:MAG: hypothetical protein LH619_01360 [Chitinophagaceae bacterium]|nr:hypothetical protein [Chitinophagaceae bacterium]